MKKYFQNPLIIPVIVLFASASLGGLPPVAIKIALKELSSTMIMFLRVSIMLPIFLLLSWPHLHLVRMHWKSIFPIAFGWAGNIVIFSFGITHTTAAVSQVIYTGVPVLVAILSPLMLKEVPTMYQIVGIGIGLIGTLITVLGGGGSLSGGNAFGNLLVFLATVSWALYVIATRKYKTVVPASVNLFVGAFIAWICFGLMQIPSGFHVPVLSQDTIYALLFLGIVGGVFMFFTHQWGAQRTPAIISGSTGVHFGDFRYRWIMVDFGRKVRIT